VHDAFGLPYFPAKRFKGLLYESAVEVYEMFKLAGMSTENLAALENVFHRNSDDAGKVSEVQIIVPNFYLKNYEKLCEDWKYLQNKYKEIFSPADVLKNFTSIRYQTKLKNGIAADGSLHNLNVLDAGTEFFGTIEILNSNDKVLNLMALAMKNLKSAGTKRNRGFGRINCTANFGIDIEKFLAKEA
jgi:CRISPR/Cas system CSM-associated protein Csm3 (group 7 of RAMP superfamily)